MLGRRHSMNTENTSRKTQHSLEDSRSHIHSQNRNRHGEVTHPFPFFLFTLSPLCCLTRILQSVLITEPTVEDTIAILRGLKERFRHLSHSLSHLSFSLSLSLTHSLTSPFRLFFIFSTFLSPPPPCRYEVHHGVRITDNALIAAAVHSNRYISDRFASPTRNPMVF